MPKFQFKAVNMSGNILEGIYEAPNQSTVIDMLRQKNYYQLEINEIVERKDMKEIELFAKVRPKDLSVYCRQFSSILRAGMPLIKCLSMLADQTDNKILAGITKDIREQVQKGSGLSQAMSLHSDKLPSILINMVAAGEASGTLDKSLEVMAVHFEKDSKTRQKVKSALRYPIIVCIVAVIVVIILLVVVVPTFVGIFETSGAALPLPTRILIGMSDVMKKYWIWLLAVGLAIAIGIKMYLSGEGGRLAFDKFKFRLPLFGKFITKSIAVRFARTMSTLMITGVSITEALEITSKILGNAYAKMRVSEVIEQVKQGKGLYGPIKSLMLFPTMLENMILMGEESGTLDQMLQNAAEFFEEEVDRETQSLTALMEPFIMVFLGGIVAFLVIAIILPMYEMGNYIS